MADPITADHFRAMMIFKHPTGLPEDVFVNSFVFRNETVGSDIGEVTDDIVAALVSFYSEPVATGSSISSLMPGNVLVAPQVRVYDLGQAPPRDPEIRVLDATAWLKGTNAASMPYQVAACISWRTAVNRPWGRGRTYIGPLTNGTIAQTAEVPRISTAARDTLVQAADRFLSGLNVKPVILGKLGPNLITGGWVDNEFDTQRRRSVEATDRLEFTA